MKKDGNDNDRGLAGSNGQPLVGAATFTGGKQEVAG